jgi:alpha-ribazole phosphatase
MTTITFIRHGQSVANAGGVAIAHPEIPLSPLGEAQSLALAQALPAQAPMVLTSTYLRAQQTAAPFARRIGVAPQAHPLLHEFDQFDFSLIQGLTGEQREPLRAAFWSRSDPHDRMGDRAETFNEFEQRVEAVMRELPTWPDGTVIFGHGMWMAMLVWKALGFSAHDNAGMAAYRRFQLALPMTNCAVYHLRQGQPGVWRVQVDEPLTRHASTTPCPSAAKMPPT